MPKVKWHGEEVEAVDVNFKSIREDWNEYLLSDGTTLRMKLVVSEVVRAEGKYDDDDNPIYLVKSSNIVVAKAPDHLKRQTQM